MPSFSANQGAFTPSTAQDNWTLEADTAGDVGKIVSVGWGGRMVTSTGYRTRWTRPSGAGTSTFTAVGGIEPHTPSYATPLLRFGTFLTAPTLPTDPDNLWSQDWNAHGGLGYIVLPLANPWFIMNGLLRSQLSCRNVSGTDANLTSYGVSWEE